MRSCGAPERVASVEAERRGDSRDTVERLADVDVAEPRDDALVEQRGLQAGLLAGARLRQHRGVELVAERLRPERAQQRLLARVAPRGTSFMQPNRRGSLNADHRARRHVEHHVVVRRQLVRALVMKLAGRSRFAVVRTTRNEPDMPRCISSTSPDDRSASRYFARRPRPVTVCAFEPLGEILRQRPAQVAAVRHAPCRSARLPSRAQARGGRFRLRAVRAFSAYVWRACPIGSANVMRLLNGSTTCISSMPQSCFCKPGAVVPILLAAQLAVQVLDAASCTHRRASPACRRRGAR